MPNFGGPICNLEGVYLGNWMCVVSIGAYVLSELEKVWFHGVYIIYSDTDGSYMESRLCHNLKNITRVVFNRTCSI